MKKIISIDVGIKNLAYCIIEKDNDSFKILSWDVINILDDKLNNQLKCSNYTRKKICSKIATNYIINNDSVDKIGFCGNKTCQEFMKNNHNSKKIKKLKKLNTKSFSILELSSILIKKLHEIKDIILNVDEVVIENQPVLKNPRMKSIQIILINS